MSRFETRWFTVLALCLATSGARGQAIVAHRGLLRHAPENTHANFAACLHLGFGFELDVRRSKDGVLVCVHDDDVKRTSDGKGKVTDLTLKQLKELDAGSWFHPSFRGERILTIDEIFGLVSKHKSRDVLVAVDLKINDGKQEAELVALAQRHGVLDKLLFIGRTLTDESIRKKLRAQDDGVGIAVVANEAAEVRDAVKDPRANWIYVRFVPTKKMVEHLHHAGKKVFIAGSTVSGNAPENWRRVSDAGVDGLLTDYPLKCRSKLSRKP